MTQHENGGALAAGEAADDHAGSALLGALAQLPGVEARQLGCAEIDDGEMSNALAVTLPGGRALLVDVEDLR
jgi:hypothetical protein